MQNIHQIAAALSLTLGLVWTTCAYGTPGERFHIREDSTSIHESPSETAPVVRHLNKGDRVIEFRRQGSWVKVSQLGAVGEDGWVEVSRLTPEPRDNNRKQVVRAIEPAPKIRPDQIRPGEPITPDTIRAGKCPAFDAAKIDRCFSGGGSDLDFPGCVDLPRKPSTHITLTATEFSMPSGLVTYPVFTVGVGNGRAFLRGAGSRECRVSVRVSRSQAHLCRKEILLSGAWTGICHSMSQRE